MPAHATRSTQLEAVQLVADGMSVPEVARRIGRPATTVRRWARADWFVSRLELLRQRALRQATSASAIAMVEAIATLRELLSPDRPDKTRALAAKTLLDYGIDSRQLDSLPPAPVPRRRLDPKDVTPDQETAAPQSIRPDLHLQPSDFVEVRRLLAQAAGVSESELMEFTSGGSMDEEGAGLTPGDPDPTADGPVSEGGSQVSA
jgi:transposase-like protein